MIYYAEWYYPDKVNHDILYFLLHLCLLFSCFLYYNVCIFILPLFTLLWLHSFLLFLFFNNYAWYSFRFLINSCIFRIIYRCLFLLLSFPFQFSLFFLFISSIIWKSKKPRKFLRSARLFWLSNHMKLFLRVKTHLTVFPVWFSDNL